MEKKEVICPGRKGCKESDIGGLPCPHEDAHTVEYCKKKIKPRLCPPCIPVNQPEQGECKKCDNGLIDADTICPFCKGTGKEPKQEEKKWVSDCCGADYVKGVIKGYGGRCLKCGNPCKIIKLEPVKPIALLKDDCHTHNNPEYEVKSNEGVEGILSELTSYCMRIAIKPENLCKGLTDKNYKKVEDKINRIKPQLRLSIAREVVGEVEKIIDEELTEDIFGWIYIEQKRKFKQKLSEVIK
jgi:hypothetical protein